MVRPSAGRYSERRPSSVPLSDSSATSRIVLTSSIITTQPCCIASTNAAGISRTSPGGVLAVGDVLVAERELVRGRAAAHLGVAVERLAAARLDRPAALGPQPVGDRPRDLALP